MPERRPAIEGETVASLGHPWFTHYLVRARRRARRGRPAGDVRGRSATCRRSGPPAGRAVAASAASSRGSPRPMGSPAGSDWIYLGVFADNARRDRRLRALRVRAARASLPRTCSSCVTDRRRARADPSAALRSRAPPAEPPARASAGRRSSSSEPLAELADRAGHPRRRVPCRPRIRSSSGRAAAWRRRSCPAARPLAILEPSTEGRLAALARAPRRGPGGRPGTRRGRSHAASGAADRPDPGPFGPERLVAGGPAHGPLRAPHRGRAGYHRRDDRPGHHPAPPRRRRPTPRRSPRCSPTRATRPARATSSPGSSGSPRREARVIVAEHDGALLGFIAIHALPRFEHDDWIVRILALVVDAGCPRTWRRAGADGRGGARRSRARCRRSSS